MFSADWGHLTAAQHYRKAEGCAQDLGHSCTKRLCVYSRWPGTQGTGELLFCLNGVLVVCQVKHFELVFVSQGDNQPSVLQVLAAGHSHDCSQITVPVSSLDAAWIHSFQKPPGNMMGNFSATAGSYGKYGYKKGKKTTLQSAEYRLDLILKVPETPMVNLLKQVLPGGFPSMDKCRTCLCLLELKLYHERENANLGKVT